MGQLVVPGEVPLWIPGRLTLNSAAAGWEHAAFKGYRYGSLDVAIPSMRDYMTVDYKDSDVTMSRRTGGPWRSEQVGRGVRSLLARGESSQRKWNRPIDVIHLYVAQTELCRAAEDVFEHSINDVGMEDCARVEDSTLPSLVSAFEEELRSGGLGGNLYRFVLVNQLCVHLLRRYAKARVREVSLVAHMADWQRRRLDQYIENNLDRNFKFKEMAGEVGVSVSGLIRKFRARLGCFPHAYILRQYLEWVRQLLNRPVATLLKCIATNCGFPDQSHLARHLKRVFEQTPVDYRSTVIRRSLPPPESDQPSW